MNNHRQPTKNGLAVILLAVLSICQLSFASASNDLYIIELPIQHQTKTIPASVINKAFQHVLIRVSGNAAVVTLPKIKEQLSQGAASIKQYSFHQEFDAATHEKKTIIRVEFIPSNINKILRDAEQTIWNAERPSILLIAIMKEKNNEDGSEDFQIISSEEQIPLLATIQSIASLRGLTITMPLMDMKDLETITPSQVLKNEIYSLKEALPRYAANALLTVKFIKSAENAYSADWGFYQHDKEQHWSVTQTDVTAVAEQGLNHIADALAAQAVNFNKTAQAQVTLHVSGINSVNDYLQLMRVIVHLAPVKSVDVIDVMPGIVDLRVEYEGSMDKLISAIANHSLLKPTATNAMGGEQLDYHLLT